MKARTFREAYGVLQRHADTLREQTEPNIDDLLKIVTESVEAYKVCKERIDAVEKALHAALADVADDVGRSAAALGSDEEEPGPDEGDEADAPTDDNAMAPPRRRGRPAPPAKLSGEAGDDGAFGAVDDDIPF